MFDDEEMTQVKLLMALADDELDVGKNHARNDKWIDITMIRSCTRRFNKFSLQGDLSSSPLQGVKNDLRKLKGKDIVDNATTMAPGMYKLDPIILAHQIKNNRETHEYYLTHTMEQAAILREVVEQAKLQNPLDSASYSACMYVKQIQELLGYFRDTI
nr:hypothetical protein [Tanacetum cinerariifolium]